MALRLKDCGIVSDTEMVFLLGAHHQGLELGGLITERLQSVTMKAAQHLPRGWIKHENKYCHVTSIKKE